MSSTSAVDSGVRDDSAAPDVVEDAGGGELSRPLPLALAVVAFCLLGHAQNRRDHRREDEMRGRNAVRITALILLLGGLYHLIRLNLDGKGLQSWAQPQPVLTLFGLIIGFILLSWQLD